MPHKTYPINRSPLYRLRNKRKLAELLDVSPKELKELSSGDSYHVFPKRDRGNKERLIEEPIGKLKRVHQIVHRFLSRIESPAYLYSGKKKISNIDNARVHRHRAHCLTADIEKFFPSCQGRYVFGFFHFQMMMSSDVAWLLTRIVTYQGHVPTGSSLSMVLAYWSYSRTFDTINNLATEHGITFTLYVDDMSFSFSEPLSHSLHVSVNYYLRRVGLHLKRSKIHYHSARHYKVITGSAISPSGDMRVPNRIRLNILNKLKACKDLRATDIRSLPSIYGSLLSARRIEEGFFESTYQEVRKALLTREQEHL